MKVLIVPNIQKANSSGNYFLSNNLISLFRVHGHEVGVYATKSNRFRHVALFEARDVKPHFIQKNRQTRSHEEWLYNNGYLDEKVLQAQITDLQQAVMKFQPDLIISLDHPAGIIVSLLTKIPSYVFVNPAMYRKTPFPTKCMHGLNQVLSSLQLEQELNIGSLYDKATRRIVVGPSIIAPMPPEVDITRIGTVSVFPEKVSRMNRICIYLETKQISQKVIEETFLGAPYIVYISMPGVTAHVHNNLHYLNHPDDTLIDSSIALIHDGNDYLYHRAIALGMPQLMISNHGYLRNYIASTASRFRFGQFIYEENISVASIYEAYREIVANDIYTEHAGILQQELGLLGDLSQLVDFTYIDLITNDAN